MGCRICLPDTINTKRNPKPELNHFLLSLSSICLKTWPIPIEKKSNSKYTASSHSIFAPRDRIENECQIKLFKCSSITKCNSFEMSSFFHKYLDVNYSVFSIKGERFLLISWAGHTVSKKTVGRNPGLNTTKRIKGYDRLE